MRRGGIICLPLLLAACSSSGGAVSAPASTCEKPSAALVARITELAPDGSRFRVLASGGEKATTQVSAYWVGVRFVAGGDATPLTGIWAVGGGLDGRGTILAVDPVAKKWSRAFDAAKSASRIADTQGRQVLRCL